MQIFSLQLFFFLINVLPVYSSVTIKSFGGILNKAGEALGPVGDVLGIVSFIMDNLPDPEKIQGTTVTIGVNKENPKSDETGFGGKIRVVWGFDTYNSVLGSSDLDQKVVEGRPTPILIHQAINEGAQAQFIDIIAGDDEVCIAYIVATFPGETDSHAWSGDVGSVCGQAWYWGGEAYGKYDNGTAYFPRCTWMDANHGDHAQPHPFPITNRQMKIDMLAYDGTPQVNTTSDYICNSSIFSWHHDDPIRDRPSQGVKSPASQHQQRSIATNSTDSPRQLRPRSQKLVEHLIINSRDHQSATELCNSPTSHGQDFVSTNEGLFCDMETKTLHPICNDRIKFECYDLDTEKMVLTRMSDPKSGVQVRSIKNYNKLSHWH